MLQLWHWFQYWKKACDFSFRIFKKLKFWLFVSNDTTSASSGCWMKINKIITENRKLFLAMQCTSFALMIRHIVQDYKLILLWKRYNKINSDLIREGLENIRLRGGAGLQVFTTTPYIYIEYWKVPRGKVWRPFLGSYIFISYSTMVILYHYNTCSSTHHWVKVH